MSISRKRLYSHKRSVTDSQKKSMAIVGLVLFCLAIVFYSIYFFASQGTTSGKKVSAEVKTGDQPLEKKLTVYINADGGLSLRGDRKTTSPRLALIPNGTKLTAELEVDGWYKVSYEGKTGWISKNYTTTVAPPEDPAKDWQTYASTAGYKVKYAPGWKVQDYGKNDALAASSIVAFSTQVLPTTIPAGTDFVAPIVFTVSTKTMDETVKTYSSMPSTSLEAITVAGKPAQKFTYTTPSTNTQVTAVVMINGSQVMIFSEAGGYSEDLIKMLNTITIG